MRIERAFRTLERGAKLEGASRNICGGTLRLIYGGILRFVKASRVIFREHS
jgi:hypothetical protein